jgi:hypothetical protein
MTEQELHMLKVNMYNVTDGVHEYSVSFSQKFLSGPIEYTFTNIKTGIENDMIFIVGLSGKYILQNPMKSNFLHNLSIKPKKEKSKMKTEFTMPPQTTKEITYPMFMKPINEEGYIVLFFQERHGVVVSTTGKYYVNYFSSTWIMNMFTPVEGCSVTFSDKD